MVKIIIICLVLLTGCNNNQQANTVGSIDSQLQMLRVNGLALSPSFEITQKHYVSTADYTVTKVSLQAWGKQSTANIEVNGKSLSLKDEFSLAVGNNVFTISISNEENITEQYLLTIIRLPEIKSNNFNKNS